MQGRLSIARGEYRGAFLWQSVLIAAAAMIGAGAAVLILKRKS